MKMKNLRKFYSVLLLALVLGGQVVYGKDNNSTANPEETSSVPNKEYVKVLIIGLPDNVQSNYFPNIMITEETGIPVDSIDNTYNQIIAKNIISANKNKRFRFVFSEVSPDQSTLFKTMNFRNDEKEEKYADLSSADKIAYKSLVDKSDADYVLFLNQHYLKWQETPLRTLFHITSYSLFDKNQHEVTCGYNYFTSLNLENQDDLKKDSKKSSSKITSSILKTISSK